MTYRRELDGVRALAVVLVICSHFPLPALSGGWIGVDIFFVLSGYLITSILVREFDRTSSIRLGQFYLRRVLRLYPALVAMLIVGAFFYGSLGDGGTLLGYLRTAAYSGLYIENFIVGYTGNAHGNIGHTWSLALEEQFYLLWAPVLLLCLRRGRSVLPSLIGGILLSTALLEWATGPNDGIPLTYFRPETRANELLLGCLLAVLLPGIQRRLEPMRWVRAAITPLALLALAGVEAFVAHNTRITRYPLEEIWAGLAAALLIVGLTVGSERSVTTRMFRTWPMVSIGRISYGMYLWLLPVVVVLPIYWHPWHGNPYVASVGTMAVIIAIATVSYFVVERPFLRLKERFQVVRSSKSLTHRHAHAPGSSRESTIGRSYPPRPETVREEPREVQPTAPG